ncbi:MAG TPA: hypothetical protein VI912_04790 [Candidatus Bilamarchaeaceae archaeon]|nr:hypothetical protein [Candidatus Bilamarchaeaceae archaeon]
MLLTKLQTSFSIPYFTSSLPAKTSAVSVTLGNSSLTLLTNASIASGFTIH